MAEKKLNLALQGGGSHGAFTWGVLDRLLDDERLGIEGISATSAGTMNAVCFVYGLMEGGRAGAKETLQTFWRKISAAGETFSPIKRLPWQQWPAPWGSFQNLSYDLFDATTRMLSPYQFNPFDFNPLRDILAETVNFERLKTCTQVKLFISTTRVRTGKVRVFNTDELSLNVVPGADILWQALNFVLSLAAISAMFALMFKYIPDVQIAWRDVWVGGFVTALLFVIGKTLIGLYLGNSGVASSYGAAGSLVVLLLWVFYSAQIVLLGGEFTQVYANRFGKGIEPAEHAAWQKA